MLRAQDSDRFMSYFTGVQPEESFIRTVGAEVETQFLQEEGSVPATLEQTQKVFERLVASQRWRVDEVNNGITTRVIDDAGTRIFYELGWHNLEVATAPYTGRDVLDTLHSALEELYAVAAKESIRPLYDSVLFCDDDVLVVPDERDQTWIALDGREALNKLSFISSVQFTVSILPEEAISVINKLNSNRQIFLQDFIQDVIWREYARDSAAGYEQDRYGGPSSFPNLRAYCNKLAEMRVVVSEEQRLVPMCEAGEFDIALFLRSIWWHFRLKKYDDVLCVEVRPLARKKDDELEQQFDQVLNLIN